MHLYSKIKPNTKYIWFLKMHRIPNIERIQFLINELLPWGDNPGIDLSEDSCHVNASLPPLSSYSPGMIPIV